MDHFTPVDTLNASNFLREVSQPDGIGRVALPHAGDGLRRQRSAGTPPEFDKEYGLYLTIDATHPAGQTGAGGVFSSLNVTLWADPNNDTGIPDVSETSGPSFSNGMANDIVLQRG